MEVLFAPTIRRQLIGALEEHLLPMTRSGQPYRMILAEPPIDLPGDIKVTHAPIPPLEEALPNGVREYDHHWRDLNLVRSGLKFPYFTVLFEGEADLRVGTSQAMAAAMPPELADSDWTRCGYHVLQLRTPTVLLFPPGVPRSDAGAHWERPNPESAHSQIFSIQILRDGLHCHLCATRGTEHLGQQSLSVEDKAMPDIAALLQQELRDGALHQEALAQDLFQILLLRLHRRLVHDEPVIANTIRVKIFPQVSGRLRPAPNWQSPAVEAPATALPSTIAQADEFIYSHLHEQLTLDMVASHCGLSPSQLNRIFRATLEISVKQYIIRQRMLAAQLMLEETAMSIKEISINLGFLHMSHFSQMFQSTWNMSPSQYRIYIRGAKGA